MRCMSDGATPGWVSDRAVRARGSRRPLRQDAAREAAPPTRPPAASAQSRRGPPRCVGSPCRAPSGDVGPDRPQRARPCRVPARRRSVARCRCRCRRGRRRSRRRSDRARPGRSRPRGSRRPGRAVARGPSCGGSGRRSPPALHARPASGSSRWASLAGRDEHPVGGGRRRTAGAITSSNAAECHVAGGPGAQRHVHGQARRSRSARLRGPPGARISGPLVGRHVQHRRVVPEDVLRAVPVVDVPVEDGDACARGRR